ncbi:hypothetical protein [Mesorhizobium sp. B2-8-9]|uniref:hypothetical protein n=1 Tax=Mesorhizobium sp. B2-8-9 TaxID=2589899 RepID=UPI00112E4157|nr:hypothetical protein [Mesorhizobium sp. B2-8-9]TPI86430.1 hypothetical protein FJ423_00985 [Mesorhizobium sp. B2-8-9]
MDRIILALIPSNGVSITVWLVLTAILAAMALIAIWARRPTAARTLAVLSLLLFSPIAGAAVWLCLGWPVPYVEGLTVKPGKHMILGVKALIGDGIYVLLDLGGEAPRYYKMPWNDRTAEQMQKALDERAAGGEGSTAGVEVKPFEFSWDTHPPQFWADPQPKVLPDKPHQEEPMHAPGQDI